MATGNIRISQPDAKLTIQMARVLHVSVKLRAVALTYFVILKPEEVTRDDDAGVEHTGRVGELVPATDKVEPMPL